MECEGEIGAETVMWVWEAEEGAHDSSCQGMKGTFCWMSSCLISWAFPHVSTSLLVVEKVGGFLHGSSLHVSPCSLTARRTGRGVVLGGACS